MIPNDTIREALRRCPVLNENGYPLSLETIKDGPDYYAYLHHSHEGDREIDCTPKEARNAMIAAWVEALRRAGYSPEFTQATLWVFDNGAMSFDIEDDPSGLLHALAAAVCEVMPEPTT